MADAPAHIELLGDDVNVTEGVGDTTIVIIVLELHVPLEPIRVYEVVTLGLTTIEVEFDPVLQV